MSARKGRRPVEHEVEHDTSERWMASYMDMVTVLMCLFIVLFAMSTVDQAKYVQLANSLATGFGKTPSTTVDTAEGVVVPKELITEDAVGFTPIQLAEQQVEALAALEAKIAARLPGDTDKVSFTIDSRGLIIRLVGSQTYFETNRALLSPDAGRIIDAIGAELAATTSQLVIEGHADARATSGGGFATNWELSSARATAVLRRLVESDGVGAERIGATGYGSARPIAGGATDADLSANRRVDIVVLTDAPDDVAALIPEVVEKQTEKAETSSTH